MENDIQRRAQAQDYHEKVDRRKKKYRNSAISESDDKPEYKLVNGKVRRIIRAPSGNAHSIYVGSEKDVGHLVGK